MLVKTSHDLSMRRDTLAHLLEGLDDHAVAQLAIGLELLLVEELVVGAVVRKQFLDGAIFQDRSAFAAGQAVLDIDQPAVLAASIIDTADRGVRLAVALGVRADVGHIDVDVDGAVYAREADEITQADEGE